MRRFARSESWAPLLGLLLAAGGCDAKPPEPVPADTTRPSPNASILPAPLASGAPPATRTAPPVGSAKPAELDGGVRDLERFSEIDPIPSDRLLPRDVPIASFEARLGFRDLVAPKGDLGKWARDRGDFALRLDTTSTRLRIVLGSDAFVLPAKSELRSRPDYRGQLLFWPGQKKYRVVPEGALRALFAERRVDVSPVVAASVSERGEGHYLGRRVERTELVTPTGKLVLEQFRAPTLGAGGLLLCRFVLELVSASAETPACARGLVPLRASATWPSGKTFTFRVLSFGERPEATVEDFLTPPDAATLTSGELPQSAGLLLPAELQAQLKPAGPAGASPRLEHEAPPAQGLVVQNRSTAVTYLWIGGLPVAWSPAFTSVHLDGLKAGRYAVEFSDFFGDEQGAADADAPGVLTLGKTERENQEEETRDTPK